MGLCDSSHRPLAHRCLAQKRLTQAVAELSPDEDMFEAVPHTAYSIRVGLTATRARYNVDSYQDVRDLLAKMRG